MNDILEKAEGIAVFQDSDGTRRLGLAESVVRAGARPQGRRAITHRAIASVPAISRIDPWHWHCNLRTSRTHPIME